MAPTVGVLFALDFSGLWVAVFSGTVADSKSDILMDTLRLMSGEAVNELSRDLTFFASGVNSPDPAKLLERLLFGSPPPKIVCLAPDWPVIDFRLGVSFIPFTGLGVLLGDLYLFLPQDTLLGDIVGVLVTK